jgi:hypothetical protein
MQDATDLAERIRAARVATELTVYRVLGTVFTIVAIEPRLLEDFPGVAVDRIADPGAIASALDAIEASRPYHSDWNVDARAGLVFSDATGQRLLSVYLGTFDWSGEIAGRRCIFEEPALRRWLDERYHDI